MPRRIIDNLNSKEYEHKADREAIEVVKHTPGMQLIVKKFYELGIERINRIQYTGSNLKVTCNNLPELYNLLQEVCYILNLENIPEFYIQKDPYFNAFTTGVDKPIIVLNSACVDSLTNDELMYIIGHEVGHIKSGHQLYHSMATIFPVLSAIIGNMTLGIGEIASKGVEIALMTWYRKSEFTADRAGLLACQDPDIVIGTIMKIAGVPDKYYSKMNPHDFINQAKEFENFDFDGLDKMLKIYSVLDMTHPWMVIRAAEMLKWVESGSYEKVLYER